MSHTFSLGYLTFFRFHFRKAFFLLANNTRSIKVELFQPTPYSSTLDLFTLKSIVPLPSLSKIRNIWSTKTLALPTGRIIEYMSRILSLPSSPSGQSTCNIHKFAQKLHRIRLVSFICRYCGLILNFEVASISSGKVASVGFWVKENSSKLLQTFFKLVKSWLQIRLEIASKLPQNMTPKYLKTDLTKTNPISQKIS